MNFLSIATNHSSLKRWVCFLLPAFLLLGCGREEIRVYNAPKDQPLRDMANDNSQGDRTTAPERPRAQLSWKLPPGWKEAAADGINQAVFIIPGTGGKMAEVTITQLSDLSGKDAMLVDMWREEAGMPHLEEQDALKQLQPVDVGGEQGRMFEVSGQNTNGPVKMITAMVHHPDGSWFYKLAGDPAQVDPQKTAFVEFLKSIQIKEARPATVNAAPAGDDTAGKFNWTVPSDWKPARANQMQVARFSLPGKAEVFVSEFSGDTGGTLLNVNRWRKQIGLDSVTEDGLHSMVSSLDPTDSQAILVDMTNDNQRLVGAIVPRDGHYWFYKLLGDAGSVGPAKDGFIAFAKSRP